MNSSPSYEPLVFYYEYTEEKDRTWDVEVKYQKGVSKVQY